MERLRWHQEHGHKCVLVSASLDVYLNAWAKPTQFSEVICTSLQENNNRRASGKIGGKNCYGEEKLVRIQKWESKISQTKRYAYGDTSGDIPMLIYVDYGYLWNNKEKRFVAI
jgi:HAD superfamily hydrolase (TIGR01490 family)